MAGAFTIDAEREHALSLHIPRNSAQGATIAALLLPADLTQSACAIVEQLRNFAIVGARMTNLKRRTIQPIRSSAEAIHIPAALGRNVPGAIPVSAANLFARPVIRLRSTAKRVIVQRPPPYFSPQFARCSIIAPSRTASDSPAESAIYRRCGQSRNQTADPSRRSRLAMSARYQRLE